MNAKAARADIAARLLAALPSGYATFASPPEVPHVPCVIIDFGTPYRQLLTYREEHVNLRLRIIGQRAIGADALDWFDDVFDDIKEALDASTYSIGWSEASPDGLVEVNGVMYLSGFVNIDVV